MNKNLEDSVNPILISMETIPKPFVYFLQELQKIEGGNIDPVSFNKRKKNAQKLLDNWIEMAGGLMFQKYLFEFQTEFELFSENLYRDIRIFQKKNNQNQQKKIQRSARKFLRKIKELPPPAEIFKTCTCHEKILFDLLQPNKVQNYNNSQNWNNAKKALGITEEFELSVKIDDILAERRESDEKLHKELYVIDSNGESVPKAFLKEQIHIDPFYKR